MPILLYARIEGKDRDSTYKQAIIDGTTKQIPIYYEQKTSFATPRPSFSTVCCVGILPDSPRSIHSECSGYR